MAIFKRLMLHNFQSIRDASIPLSPSFNVIVGANGRGKSSLVRALRWVCRDAFRGTWFVTLKEDFCEVGVRVEDSIVVRKVSRSVDSTGNTARLKTNSYAILKKVGTNTEFEKFKDIPPEVVDALGISLPIVLGKTSDEVIDMNFADQHKDAIFLLNKPSSIPARLISRVIGLDPVLAAMRSIASASRAEQQTVKQQELRRVDLSDKVQGFHAEALKRSFDVVSSKVQAVKDLGQAYNDLKSLFDEFVGLEVSIALARRDIKVLSTVTCLPWAQAEQACSDVQELKEARNSFLKIQKDLESCGMDKTTFSHFDHKILLFLSNNADDMQLLEDFRSISEACNFAAHDAQDAELQAENAKQAFHDKLQELGVCPLCGQSTEGDVCQTG